MAVFVGALLELIEEEVARDVVPCGAVTPAIAYVTVSAVQEIGGEQDDGASRHFKVDRFRLVHVDPAAVGAGIALVRVCAGQMAAGDNLEATVLPVRVVEIDAACDNPVGLTSLMRVVCTPRTQIGEIIAKPAGFSNTFQTVWTQGTRATRGAMCIK